MTTYPPPATDSQPELIADDGPAGRPRWVQLATSADHKTIGLILISISLGSLFLAALEFLLLRFQLSIPENVYLSPVTFDRLLSAYGTTAIFLFALPLIFGLFYYLAPLQIGSRGTALPRLGQFGLWGVLTGGAILYGSFMFTPSEAGINPLPPLSELAFSPNNGVDVWITGTGLIVLGLVMTSIDLLATMHTRRAPGLAWRRMPVFSSAATMVSWMFVLIGPIFLGAITMLMIDRNYDGIFFSGSAGGAPLLWQHLTWIFFNGVYAAVAITSLAALAEIIPALSRRPLQGRGAIIGSLAAIAVLTPLDWTQNMMQAPIGIGWKYYAMLIAMALIIPFGLIFFNLISTVAGGSMRYRGPIRFALGALSVASIGLAAEIAQSMIAVGTRMQNTYDAWSATHYALIGLAVFGGLAALHYWYPKMTGRTMGESLSRLSFWTLFVGVNLTFLPLFGAGIEGQVTDAYKFFDGQGLNAWNLIALFGAIVLIIGVILVIVNAILSRNAGPRAGHDPWGGDTLEWLTLSPPPPHNFDVRPDVRSARPMRDIRDAIARREASDDKPVREPQSVA